MKQPISVLPTNPRELRLSGSPFFERLDHQLARKLVGDAVLDFDHVGEVAMLTVVLAPKARRGGKVIHHHQFQLALRDVVVVRDEVNVVAGQGGSGPEDQ